MVLHKYDVTYSRCCNCGFIQTETPYWLAESYSSAMTSYDLGGVSRPRANSAVTKSVIDAFFDKNGRFLDFGGGYGILTRWMRDIGYDFWHSDAHTPNLLAQGFEADLSLPSRYELATAFEVFEHLANPRETVGFLFGLTNAILFTTDLVPEPAPQIKDWWYFGPEHGQHIAFYTRKALTALAEQHGSHYVTNGGSFHLLTRKPVPSRLFRIVVQRHVSKLLYFLRRRPSLLPSDFQDAMTKAKSSK